MPKLLIADDHNWQLVMLFVSLWFQAPVKFSSVVVVVVVVVVV